MQEKAERKSKGQSRLGIGLLIALSLAWGSNWPAMKFVLAEVRPWTFRTLCLFVGGAGLLTMAKLAGFSLSIPRTEVKPLLLATLLNVTGWYLLSAYGLIHMRAARAVIIAYTMPVWAVILGRIILKEPFSPARAIGLGLGLTGLAVLVVPGLRGVSISLLGVSCILGSAISWAGGTIVMKYFRWSMSTLLLTGWQILIGGIPIAVGALILEPVTGLAQISWKALLVMGYTIFLGIIFGQWAWFKVVDLFPATVAAIGILAVPVVGVFSGALFLGERVGFYEIVGLILVVTALAVVMIGPEGLRPGSRKLRP
jgi:drug/metabolite transporter (DMT)-like permease